MKILLLILNLAVFSLPAQATIDLGREGNGGDPIALEFLQRGLGALKESSNIPALKEALSAVKPEELLKGLSVIVVDAPLIVEKNGVQQSSAAKNIPAEKKILIHRESWLQITDGDLKNALALHELLGIAGLETTGEYTFSRAYLEHVSRKQSLKRSSSLEGKSHYDTLADWFAAGERATYAELKRTVNIGRCFRAEMPDQPIAFILGGIEYKVGDSAGPGLPSKTIPKIFFTFNPSVNPATYDKFPRSNGYDYSWDYKYYDFVTQKYLGKRYSAVSEEEKQLTSYYDQSENADGALDIVAQVVRYNDYYVVRIAHISMPEKSFANCYSFRKVARK